MTLLDSAQLVGSLHGLGIGSVFNGQPFGEIQSVGDDAQRGIFQDLSTLIAHVVTEFPTLVIQGYYHLSAG